jgi:hypothetical protein
MDIKILVFIIKTTLLFGSMSIFFGSMSIFLGSMSIFLGLMSSIWARFSKNTLYTCIRVIVSASIPGPIVRCIIFKQNIDTG